METMYETAGRDKWMVAFERIVRSIDSVLWHCVSGSGSMANQFVPTTHSAQQHEEWVVILPMALILAYLSYTLQLSTTFPYFTHLPLCDTASSGNRRSSVTPLPLYKAVKSRSDGSLLFASDFTIRPTTAHTPLWRRNTPSHVPARPSPLRKSFTQNDSVRPHMDLACKTSYFSPHTPCSEKPVPASFALPQLANRCLAMDDAMTIAGAISDITSTFAGSEGSSACAASSRVRSRGPPKKAKSMDNFRTTLFPLLETDEAQPNGSIWGLPKQQQRMQGKRRRCSAL